MEKCEKHPKAQLAYSFDIAMQNELTLEENMELARKFVQEQFVAKGMIADLALHSPDKEDGGIPNPHFHVMTTMRPLNPDGTWRGQKQRREAWSVLCTGKFEEKGLDVRIDHRFMMMGKVIAPLQALGALSNLRSRWLIMKMLSEEPLLSSN